MSVQHVGDGGVWVEPWQKYFTLRPTGSVLRITFVQHLIAFCSRPEVTCINFSLLVLCCVDAALRSRSGFRKTDGSTGLRSKYTALCVVLDDGLRSTVDLAPATGAKLQKFNASIRKLEVGERSGGMALPCVP